MASPGTDTPSAHRACPRMCTCHACQECYQQPNSPHRLPLCIHNWQTPDLLLKHDVCGLLHRGSDRQGDGWGSHVLGHALLHAASCFALPDDVLQV